MLPFVQMEIVLRRQLCLTNETLQFIFKLMIFIVGVRSTVAALETRNELLIFHVTSFVRYVPPFVIDVREADLARSALELFKHFVDIVFIAEQVCRLFAAHCALPNNLIRHDGEFGLLMLP